MRKALTLPLLLAVLLASLGGCSLRLNTLRDEEAVAILREKAPEARELADFFYGSIPLRPGAEAEIDEGWTTSHYFPVAEDYRFQTEAQVKEAAERVYTAEFLEPVYAYCFEGSDEFTSRFGEYEGTLTVDVTKPSFGQMPTLDYGSAHVVRGTRFSCRVEVQSADGGDSYVIDLSYDKASESWKFDSLVY